MVNKIKWIDKKQREFEQKKSELIKPEYKDQTTLSYLGYNRKLRIVTHENDVEQNVILYKQQKFIAYIASTGTDIQEIIKKLYEDWHKLKADKIFKEKVRKYGKIMGHKPIGTEIKDLKKRWGSLDKNKTINININLLKAPEDVTDYIIIHELCHLTVDGHTYRFLDYLKQFEPDYEKKINWLERNSGAML